MTGIRSFAVISLALVVLLICGAPAKARASSIQLEGALFTDVQMGRVFPDSKTFVDAVPRSAPDAIRSAYERERVLPGFDLRAFVERNFMLPSDAGAAANLPRSLPMERYIDRLWSFLERRPDAEVPESTLIPLPHPYIVPGGRFREIYYWDSYFTAEGLAASGRRDMVAHMAENFAFLIDRLGHIPNGNRLYYTSRSQPPLFACLVAILERSGGARAALPYLPRVEREYAFWMKGAESLTRERPAHARVVLLDDGSVLNRYWDDRAAPREESYREDVELCGSVKPHDAEKFSRDIRAAAESGWDFSSRWFKDGNSIATIRTTEIVPVDLNCILYDVERKLSRWSRAAGNAEAAARYDAAAARRRKALLKYCWDGERAYFFDYCLTEKSRTRTWSLAGAYPLFFRLATGRQAACVAQALREKFLCPGGLVTTLSEGTGQQWDSPNGWAPLHWIAVQGLRSYGCTDTAELIAGRFTENVRGFYRATGRLVEKYDVRSPRTSAGGGEYALQEGFGWTNGVVIALLRK